MAVINWVWPITALYWGPVALGFYVRRARRMSPRWAAEHDVDLEQMMRDDEPDPPS